MPRYEWQLVNLKTKAIFPVRKTITTVGRNINADFKLRASVVSRQHAHLVVGEDGGLYVEALESATNGVFLNGIVIPRNKFVKVAEGDKIGFGLAEGLSLKPEIPDEQYCIYIVRRINLAELVVIDSSDEEETNGNKEHDHVVNIAIKTDDGKPSPPTAKSSSAKILDVTVIQPRNSHSNVQDFKEVIIQSSPKKAEDSSLREDNAATTTSSNQAPEQSEGTNMVDSTVNHCAQKLEDAHHATEFKKENEQSIKQEQLPRDSSVQYNMVNDYIIIDDDDEDDCPALSQVFGMSGSQCAEQNFENVFFTIKKELEEMDKVDGELGPFDVAASQSEDEDILDILLSENHDDPAEAIQSGDLASPKKVTMTSTSFDDIMGSPPPDNSNKEVPSNHTNGNLVSPVRISTKTINKKFLQSTEPHVLINTKTSSKKSIELPAQAKQIKKRKSDTGNVDTKKIKRKRKSKDVIPDMEGLRRQLRNREAKASEINKENREAINQLRKSKLKEIAIKTSEKPSSSNVRTKPGVKVKVSGGRGDFLLNEIVKPKEIVSANKVTPRRASDETRIENNASLSGASTSGIVKQTTNNHKSVSNISAEEQDGITEILSWSPNWMLKNTDDSPPLSLLNVRVMLNSFPSYAVYSSVLRPVLLIELWHSICREQLCSNKLFPVLFNNDDISEYKNCIQLSLTTYINDQDLTSYSYVKAGDLLLVELVFYNEKGNTCQKPAFGYVTETHHIPLDDNYVINTTVAKFVESPLRYQIDFKMCVGQVYEGNVIKGRFSMCKVITSLNLYCRLYKSLKYLETSPLKDYVLDPMKLGTVTIFPLNEAVISGESLNNGQKEVVLKASYVAVTDKPGIYLIKGPPGSGKSTVISSIIQQLLFRKQKSGQRILLISPSSVALDSLVLRLTKTRASLPAIKKKDFKLIRIGPQPSGNVVPFTINEMTKRNVLMELLRVSQRASENYKRCQEELHGLQEQIAHLAAQGIDVTEHKKKLHKLEYDNDNFAKGFYSPETYATVYRESSINIFRGANVVCATMSSCMSRIMEENKSKVKFTCCIIDDSTLCSEQQVLLPLSLGVSKLILVGDPAQRPGISLTARASNLGHGKSLFTRIDESFPVGTAVIGALCIQYRMDSEICAFPNKLFYKGKIMSRICFDKPYMDMGLRPYLVFNLTGKVNSESSVEITCLLNLLKAVGHSYNGSKKLTIGIITPAHSLKEEMNRQVKILGLKENVEVNCGSVESFHGQERDVIILSCVKSTRNGFLNDPCKVGIAITRAKNILYILGSAGLFKNNEIFSKIKVDALSRNLLRNIDRPDINNLAFYIAKRM